MRRTAIIALLISVLCACERHRDPARTGAVELPPSEEPGGLPESARADFSGFWIGSLQSDAGPYDVTLLLSQEENLLSGRLESTAGAAAVTGQVSGGGAELQLSPLVFALPCPAQGLGRLQGSGESATLSLFPGGPGSFTPVEFSTFCVSGLRARGPLTRSVADASVPSPF